MDEHGYNQQPGEPLETWRDRTAPLSYAYAMIVEAQCEHHLAVTEPYCTFCGMLMEG